MRYSLRKVSTFIQSSIRSAKEYAIRRQYCFLWLWGAGAACCVTAALPSAVENVPTFSSIYM